MRHVYLEVQFSAAVLGSAVPILFGSPTPPLLRFFSRDDEIFKEVDFGMEVDFGAEDDLGDLNNLLGESSSLFQTRPGSNGDTGFSGGKFDEDSLLPRSHKVKVRLERVEIRRNEISRSFMNGELAQHSVRDTFLDTLICAAALL